MNEFSSSFVLRVSSIESSNIFTTNNATNFRVQLPQTISLNGNWQVALTSINHASNISIADYLSHQDLWISFEPLFGHNHIIKIDMGGERIGSYADLQHLVNNRILVHFRTPEFRIVIDENLEASYEIEDDYRVKMSPILASILGLRLNNFIALETEGLSRLLGTVNIERGLPNGIMLYSDFTKPIINGGKYEGLLKFIPLLSKQNEIHSYQSQHLDFVDTIGLQEMQTIHFEIKDGMGTPITFENMNNAVTYLNLLFRKI